MNGKVSLSWLLITATGNGRRIFRHIWISLDFSAFRFIRSWKTNVWTRLQALDPVSFKEILRKTERIAQKIIRNQAEGKIGLYGLIADQIPHKIMLLSECSLWIRILAVMNGSEQLAKKFGFPGGIMYIWTDQKVIYVRREHLFVKILRIWKAMRSTFISICLKKLYAESPNYIYGHIIVGKDKCCRVWGW